MLVKSLKGVVMSGVGFLVGLVQISATSSLAFGDTLERRDSTYTSIARRDCIIATSSRDESLIETWACPGLLDENGRGYKVNISKFEDGDALNLETPDSPLIDLKIDEVFDFARITGTKIEWRGRVDSRGHILHDSLIVRVASRTHEERLVIYKINVFRACLVAAVPANDPRGANRLARQIADVVVPGTDCAPDADL